MSTNKQEKNKTAMLCWSDLQLINSLNYAYHSTEKIDLFIQYGSYHTPNLVEELRKSNIFSNVFVYDVPHWHYSKIYVLIKTFADLITKNSFHRFICDNLRSKPSLLHLYYMTQNYIKTSHMVVDGDFSSEIRSYNKVLATWADDLTIQLLINNKTAEMVLYDDGIGSYSRDMFDLHINPDAEKWCSRLDISINKLRPSKLLLSNSTVPVNCKYEIESLMPIYGNYAFVNFLNNIFNYKSYDTYRGKRIIYLTQPYAAQNPLDPADTNKLEDTEKGMLSTIGEYTDDLIIRPHPRDKERIKPLLGKYNIDFTSNVWELICANELTDEHILIGACSTAQFTPKWWYDIEPWIIITYDLLISDLPFFNESYLENAQKLKASYRNPDKVIFVRNNSELKASVSYILSTF